jgi:xylan 1,4-beta-xylosidase
MIKNPIISGFYPDPSIIRIEDDVYIINSSFEYYPAIPIWHTRDFKHVKQIGHAIDRIEQGLDLSSVNPSGGIQAATLRYHQGMFYITSTLISKDYPTKSDHFIIYAKNIEGPWSKLHFIEGAEGIDSSLFFDEDGACYFLANRMIKDQHDGGKTELWISKFNIETFQLEGDIHALWQGTGGVFPEGPHLYKKEGRHYLVIAEGGTLHHHAVTVAYSDHIFGPYQSSKRNPLLTHRHLHRTYPIQNVGHADLVELKDGSWIGVCLGSRPQGGFYDGINLQYSFGGYYRNLGRETFVFPVSWPTDQEGPLLCGDTGKLEESYTLNLPEYKQTDTPVQLSEASLKMKWVHLHHAERHHVQLQKQDHLTLTLQDTLVSSFIGFRQTSWKQNISFDVDISKMEDVDQLNIVAWLSEYTSIGIELTKDCMYFKEIYQGKPNIHHHVNHPTHKHHIEILLDSQDYTFKIDDHQFTFDGRVISPDLNDSHTGVLIGFTGISKTQTTIEITHLKVL